MGREMRRVPPNWRHPKKDDGSYKPMYDQYYRDALETWIAEYTIWEVGGHPDQKKYPDKTKCEFWEWSNKPPDPEYYRPQFCCHDDWYQVYETVSEGTPVTPPFETQEELINYLVENGDYWDQSRGHGGWNRERAEEFVKSGWSATGYLANGKVYMARDLITKQNEEE